MMIHDPNPSPIDRIVHLARQIIDECPSGAGCATEIIMWTGEIRAQRPSREELAALIDVFCKDSIPDDHRDALVSCLRAVVLLVG
jgi:hypothetical protein